MIRFRVNWNKCIEAVDLLARHQDEITQYYVGKVCYFADKEHLLDYGRPITGDRYIAMEHGPVPSAVYDLLKGNSGLPDEVMKAFSKRIRLRSKQNMIQVSSRRKNHFENLSETDQEYLLAALKLYGNMSFAELRELTHKETAWSRAWEKEGIANEMNAEYWLKELGEDAELAKSQLSERAYIA